MPETLTRCGAGSGLAPAPQPTGAAPGAGGAAQEWGAALGLLSLHCTHSTAAEPWGGTVPLSVQGPGGGGHAHTAWPPQHRAPLGTSTPAVRGEDQACHSPKGGRGSCPTARPPTEPCCPLRERGQEGAAAAAEGRREGRGWPRGGVEPRPGLCPRRSCAPTAAGSAPLPPGPRACCYPGCRGVQGSCCCCTHLGAGRRGCQSLELSPEHWLPWPCSLPPGPGQGRILPCLGLIHSHRCESVSVAPVECLSVHLFVQGVQRAVAEPAAANKLVGEQQRRQCRQPGGDWGGGTAPAPREGQSAARAGPEGSAADTATPGTGACPGGPVPAPQPAFTKQTTFTAQLNTGSM